MPKFAKEVDCCSDRRPVHPRSSVSNAIKEKVVDHKQDYKAQLNIIFDALEDKKATDIVMMDLTAVSDSLDYFVICSATSQPQMGALERHVLEKLLEIDVRAASVEGPSPRWVLINLGAILVHLMTPETRDFYDLEGLWADAKQIQR